MIQELEEKIIPYNLISTSCIYKPRIIFLPVWMDGFFFPLNVLTNVISVITVLMHV